MYYLLLKEIKNFKNNKKKNNEYIFNLFIIIYIIFPQSHNELKSGIILKVVDKSVLLFFRNSIANLFYLKNTLQRFLPNSLYNNWLIFSLPVKPSFRWNSYDKADFYQKWIVSINE